MDFNITNCDILNQQPGSNKREREENSSKFQDLALGSEPTMIETKFHGPESSMIEIKFQGTEPLRIDRKCRFRCLFRSEDSEAVKDHEVKHHSKERQLIMEYRRVKEDFDEDEEEAAEEADFGDYVVDWFKQGKVNFSAFGPKFDAEGKKFIFCGICPFHSISKYRVSKHKLKVHPNVDVLQCPECPIRCFGYGHLTGHLHSDHARPSFRMRRTFLMREQEKMKEFHRREIGKAENVDQNNNE